MIDVIKFSDEESYQPILIRSEEEQGTSEESGRVQMITSTRYHDHLNLPHLNTWPQAMIWRS